MSDVKIGEIYRWIKLMGVTPSANPLKAKVISIKEGRVYVKYLTDRYAFNQEDEWELELFLSCFKLIYQIEGFEV